MLQKWDVSYILFIKVRMERQVIFAQNFYFSFVFIIPFNFVPSAFEVKTSLFSLKYSYPFVLAFAAYILISLLG